MWPTDIHPTKLNQTGRVSVLSCLARVWVVSVCSSLSLALAVLVCDTYSHMLFTVFHFSHCSIEVTVSFVDYILSFLLDGMFYALFSSPLTWFWCTWAEGLSETASLPPRGSGKVCVHSTLPRPHLVGFHWVCCCCCFICI